MQLTLEEVTKRVGSQTHLYPISLAVRPGEVTVLLGATQAGKTSLMRVMAGLDRPNSGRVLVDDRDVTAVQVRERAVSMVYQQFINYPSMTVFDNIASPLKLQRATGIDSKVRALAAKLHIDHLLDRYPSQLSGGQQQRVALARALAKDAALMLLDEPLVNLDYKLREELREELTQLFAAGSSTVVYATTEPGEALLMGGYTAVLQQGRLLQYGPTTDVFLRPASIDVARAFSDPPMNLIAGTLGEAGVQLPGGLLVPATVPGMASVLALAGDKTGGAAGGSVSGAVRPVTVGFRAGSIAVVPRPASLELAAEVELAEISGSDTFVYADTPIGEVVAQLTGVHRFELGQRLPLYLDIGGLYVFDAAGKLVLAPHSGGR